MDFGAVDLDNFVRCSSTVTVASNSGGSSFEIDMQKGFVPGFLKQERGVNEQTHSSIQSEGQHQMLSFSSPASSGTAALPYYHQTSAGFSRLTGLNSAGAFSGMRIPFTPSQWMELEDQALIYKYLTSNVPIPSCLLNPIRKHLESAVFSTFPGLRSNPLGWGASRLGGFSSSDPEPGRCRRTDGKKWRCSRDALADQKYCERHMNRGRHRSRKPVEGQSGHAATRTTTAMNNKPAAAGTPATKSVSVSRQPASVILAAPNFESLLGKEEFGFVSADSAFNPLDRSSALGRSRSNGTSDDKDNNPFRGFMDAWSGGLSDRTQLSISIPIAAATDFMPSPSSPTSSKLQRSCQEFQMCLAVGSQHKQRQAPNCVPISWEPSMAGPLGEVLHSRTCATRDPLSSHLTSSPTGVLSSSTFGSLSSSSAGSSPRADSSKALDGATLSNGTIKTTSLPEF